MTRMLHRFALLLSLVLLPGSAWAQSRESEPLPETHLPVPAPSASQSLHACCPDTGTHRSSCRGGNSKKLVYVDVLGTVFEKETPNAGDLHMYGSFELSTADYFRGRYDGVPEDEEMAAFPTLAFVFELWEGHGALSNLNLTVGNQNGWGGDPGPAQHTDFWYEANPYVGFSGRYREDWLFGVTYTRYDSLDGVFGTTDEVATSVAYAPGQGFWSRLKPQFKAAVPTDPTGGALLQGRLTPSTEIRRPCKSAITLRAPLIVGVGLDDYYGADTSGATYGSFGLEASVPIRSIPERCGNWSFDVGVRTVVRDQDIVRQGFPVDDAENTVVVGTTGISFVY